MRQRFGLGLIALQLLMRTWRRAKHLSGVTTEQRVTSTCVRRRMRSMMKGAC